MPDGIMSSKTLVRSDSSDTSPTRSPPAGERMRGRVIESRHVILRANTQNLRYVFMVTEPLCFFGDEALTSCTISPDPRADSGEMARQTRVLRQGPVPVAMGVGILLIKTVQKSASSPFSFPGETPRKLL